MFQKRKFYNKKGFKIFVRKVHCTIFILKKENTVKKPINFTFH